MKAIVIENVTFVELMHDDGISIFIALASW